MLEVVWVGFLLLAKSHILIIINKVTLLKHFLKPKSTYIYSMKSICLTYNIYMYISIEGSYYHGLVNRKWKFRRSTMCLSQVGWLVMINTELSYNLILLFYSREVEEEKLMMANLSVPPLYTEKQMVRDSFIKHTVKLTVWRENAEHPEEQRKKNEKRKREDSQYLWEGESGRRFGSHTGNKSP